MTNIPPTNLAGSVVQATVVEKQQAETRVARDREKDVRAREAAKAADAQEHEVEDTLEVQMDRVRRQDDEESHHQRQHKHRQMPEDDRSPIEVDEDGKPHIDLQA
jgi:hypothetical protein